MTDSDNGQKELHIAPMLDVSLMEFHHLYRILSKRVTLWTEMVVDETVMYTNDLDHHMGISCQSLHPIICQIGGRSPKYCAEATKAVRRYGYKEVNLNIDCPSSRVSGKRQFGAILMAKKHQQACYDVIRAMKDSSECNLKEIETLDEGKSHDAIITPTIPISVKTRVGIETEDGICCDDLEYLSDFIDNLRKCGCKRFVIHARKCVIGGLTPAENRLVPPLNYPRFYSLCRRFPDCKFVINGGIPGLEVARKLCYGDEQVNDVDHHSVPCKKCNVLNGSCTAPQTKSNVPQNLVGCMIGRACMDNPSMFWDIDRYFYGMEKNPCNNRREVLEKYCEYIEKTYPRRCSDSDERVTRRFPAPSVHIAKGGCHICKEFYGHERIYFSTADDIPTIKISSRVVDRSLKPIQGIFFGLPKSKLFRRECDRLSRNKEVRNCGPGYIIRKALTVMPDEILDENFTKTEDLIDIPSHVSPQH